IYQANKVMRAISTSAGTAWSTNSSESTTPPITIRIALNNGSRLVSSQSSSHSTQSPIGILGMFIPAHLPFQVCLAGQRRQHSSSDNNAEQLAGLVRHGNRHPGAADRFKQLIEQHIRRY